MSLLSKIKIAFSLITIAFSLSALGQNKSTVITGFVHDKQNEPLAYVNVFIQNTFDGAMTDESGRFEFTTKQTGEITLTASLVGYKKYKELFTVNGLEGKPVEITLVSESVQTNEVIVTASSFSSDKEKGIMVTSMDVMTTPGGAADIFQSLKTMPGLTQVSESAELYVRGGDPYETLTLYNQATLNHPYTFESSYGGIFSNINTNSISDMYFSSGGFSAKYGNALSGVLALESKDKPESREIGLSLSLASSEINTAIPVSENIGIRLDGRQSYTAPIFWFNGNNDEFTVAPISSDFNSSLTYQYSKTGKLKISGYTATDKQSVNIDQPGYTDQFDGNSNSTFVNLQLQNILFGSVVVKSSLSRSNYKNDWKLGILDLTTEDTGIKSRSDLEYVADASLKLSGGVELENRNTKYIGVIPAEDYDLRDEAQGEVINANFDVLRVGGYMELEKSGIFGVPNYFIVGGLRADYIDELNINWFDPRINTGYKLSDKSTVSLGWGIFHQHPDPRLYSPSDGNPNLKEMRADHYILSYDYKINENDNFRIEAYYKDYDNLPLEDDEINYNDNGYGYAKGIDVLFKGNITSSLSGWVSYSFIDTKRKWMDYEEFTSSEYDITHNLSIVAKYNVSPAFQVGINYKYATGKPFTPVTGSIYREDLNIYEPVYGVDYSSRFPDYNRLDVRFTYLKNLFDKWFSVFYVEALNILDIKNIFDYSYNYDYSKREEVASYFGSRTIVFGMVINL